MFTEEEKKLIKELLGNHYTRVIKQYLDNKRIYKHLTNTPYTEADIRAVFCGARANEDIEDAFLAKVVEAKKRRLEMKSILNKDEDSYGRI